MNTGYNLHASNLKETTLRNLQPLVSLLIILVAFGCKARSSSDLDDATGVRQTTEDGNAAWPMYWIVRSPAKDIYLCRGFCSEEPKKLSTQGQQDRQRELNEHRKNCSMDLHKRIITDADLASSEDAATVLLVLTDEERQDRLLRLDDKWTTTIERFLASTPATGAKQEPLPQGIRDDSDSDDRELPAGISDPEEVYAICHERLAANASVKPQESSNPPQSPSKPATRVASGPCNFGGESHRKACKRAHDMKVNGLEYRKNWWGGTYVGRTDGRSGK
jgi:hypothetical protein